MLSTPPAFILSQDQTLVKNLILLMQVKFKFVPGPRKLLAFLSLLLFFRLTFKCLFWIILFDRIFRDVVYCSIIKVLCFCLSHATAILEYHIFVSLSTTFLNFIFKLFAHNYILSLCSRRYRFPSRDSLVRIAHNVVNCQHCFCFFFNLNNLFNFHAIKHCFLTILPTHI